jgi:RNA polymerase sigma factor (sigma-70 family)
VNNQTDAQLLGAYAESRSEAAFTELVRRHVDMVYSAALRMVCGSHLAEDVTQAVFVALASNAPQLTHRAILSGWLHRTAQNIAAQTVRTDVRRRVREQEAAAMNELLSSQSDTSWDVIAPHLDAALGELNDADRDALMLRYFEKKSAAEMAGLLGISDEAAQKRVSRAVERLRELFAKRGVTVGAGGLGVVITASAVQAAPAGLVATISSAALAGTAVSTSAFVAATKTIAMTTLQKLSIGAALTAAIGTGIYQAHQAAQLREQNQVLEQKQSTLAGDLARLQNENGRLSNLVAQTKDQNGLSQADLAELLKLRGQTGQARTAVQQLEQLKNSAARQNDAMPSFFTNAMMQGIKMSEKFRRNDATAKLKRMIAQLQLTDAQAGAISNIMMSRIESSSQQALNAMLHKQAPDWDSVPPVTDGSEQANVKAVLTPDQLAAYPAYEQAEATTTAENSASSELTMISKDMELTQDQKDKVQAALYQYDLNQQSANPGKDAVSQARATGDYASVVRLQIETQQQALQDKIKVLGDILTPDQLATYQQKQTEMIDMQSSAMNMFLPQTNAVVKGGQ